ASQRAWPTSPIDPRREGDPDLPPAPPLLARTRIVLPTEVVVIYGASWCGPCHQAADYLKARGVLYVLKDIESTPGAREEMVAKCARLGMEPRAIPILDVGGQILVGFNAEKIDRALAGNGPRVLERLDRGGDIPTFEQPGKPARRIRVGQIGTDAGTP